MIRPLGAVRAFNGVGVGSATMHSACAVVAMMHVASVAKVIFICTTLSTAARLNESASGEGLGG